MKRLRIAIQSDGLVYRDGDKWYCESPFLFFAREIGRFFSKTFFLVPVNEHSYRPNRPCFFCYDNQEIVALRPYASVKEYYMKIPFFLVANSLAMLRAIKSCDVIFLRIPSMNSIVAFTLGLLCKKIIVTYCVGDEVEVVREGEKYEGRIKKQLALFAARIDRMVQRLIMKRCQVTFFHGTRLKTRLNIGNRYSYVTFTSLVRKDDIVVRRVCENKVIKLVYVGRMAHEKGIKYLAEAFRIMKINGRELQLVIVGDGDYLDWLKEFVVANGLTGRVLLVGYQKAEILDKILSDCDIFIIPSLSEGIPKVLLQAMAKGLPIIATDIGGIPDIITHIENGILVPPRSPEAIAENVKLLIENAPLRNKIVENGYRFVREHTMDVQAKKIAETIYEAVEK